MNHLIQKSLMCTLGVALALTTTGCMTSPGHGEIVGKKSDKVYFGGYLTDPDQWVSIQARHPSSGWITIGYAKSKSYSFTFDGTQWYPWSVKLIVPNSYWTAIGYGYNKVDVRALRYSTGGALATWKGDFSDWFDVNESLGDLWNEHGHGSTATIFATNN